MFNAAGGSLLVAIIFHAQMNGPARPDAQPWDMVRFVLVAILVVTLTRRMMLRPDRGTTAVLLEIDFSARSDVRGSGARPAPPLKPDAASGVDAVT